MKKAAGLIVLSAGVLGGLYIATWFMLVGGIVQTMEAFKATPIPLLDVAIGIVRIIFSPFAGWLTFWTSAAIAGALLK